MKKYAFIQRKQSPEVWWIVVDPHFANEIDPRNYPRIIADGLEQGFGNLHHCMFNRLPLSFAVEDWQVKEYDTQEELILDNIVDIL